MNLQMTTGCSVGHFRLTTWCGHTDRAPAIRYDLALSFVGWEERGVEIVSLPAEIARAVVVVWKESRTEFEGYAATVLTGLKARGADVERVAFSMIVDIDTVLDYLGSSIERVAAACGRPIHVLIDISNCPEIISMALVAKGFASGTVALFTVFYAEAIYNDTSGSRRVEFTRGEWNRRVVPGLEGVANPATDTLLVLGLGFEGAKARQMVALTQPHSLCAILPDPGFTKDYTREAARQNADILKMLVYSDEPSRGDVLVRSPAGNLVDVLTKIVACVQSRATQNIVMIPTGPKPHALAMALAAFENDRCTVLYRNPEQYTIMPSAKTGVSWISTVRDASVAIGSEYRNDIVSSQRAWIAPQTT